MDINSIGNFINTTTFPIALVIILLIVGYKLFNRYVAPLIQSCIDSNKEFIISLEKISSKIKDVDDHVGNVDKDVKVAKEDIKYIKQDIKRIKDKLN